jgi:hypothetical protein
MRLADPELQLTLSPTLIAVAVIFDLCLTACAVAAARHLRRTPLA